MWRPRTRSECPFVILSSSAVDFVPPMGWPATWECKSMGPPRGFAPGSHDSSSNGRARGLHGSRYVQPVLRAVHQGDLARSRPVRGGDREDRAIAVRPPDAAFAGDGRLRLDDTG